VKEMKNPPSYEGVRGNLGTQGYRVPPESMNFENPIYVISKA
jgi:hypothetical protein